MNIWGKHVKRVCKDASLYMPIMVSELIERYNVKNKSEKTVEKSH